LWQFILARIRTEDTSRYFASAVSPIIATATTDWNNDFPEHFYLNTELFQSFSAKKKKKSLMTIFTYSCLFACKLPSQAFVVDLAVGILILVT
jgi:hypothetical protein